MQAYIDHAELEMKKVYGYSKNLWPILSPFKGDAHCLLTAVNISRCRFNGDSALVYFESKETTFPILFVSNYDVRQEEFVSHAQEFIGLVTFDSVSPATGEKTWGLAPCDVVAFSSTSGIIAWPRNSETLAHICSPGVDRNLSTSSSELSIDTGSRNPIISFLHSQKNSHKELGGIGPDVVDRLICSAACSSVITHALGVTNRGLDTQLLDCGGTVTQFDFTYCLQPFSVISPYQNPLAFASEMIKATFGVTSEEHERFVGLCEQAFALMQQNMSLLINVVWLMKDASITELSYRDHTAGPIEIIRTIHDRMFLLPDVPTSAIVKYLLCMYEEGEEKHLRCAACDREAGATRSSSPEGKNDLDIRRIDKGFTSTSKLHKDTITSGASTDNLLNQRRSTQLKPFSESVYTLRKIDEENRQQRHEKKLAAIKSSKPESRRSPGVRPAPSPPKVGSRLLMPTKAQLAAQKSIKTVFAVKPINDPWWDKRKDLAKYQPTIEPKAD
jgi:hypothetical protein